jgi:hypothetical protein
MSPISRFPVVVFEHHEMKSSGRPDRRIDRLERILAWLDRHL